MSTDRWAPGPRTGRVEEFDERRGTGTVLSDDGTSYPFHCTAITDGTRTVAAGTRVVFEAAAGHLGRLEARSLTGIG